MYTLSPHIDAIIWRNLKVKYTKYYILCYTCNGFDNNIRSNIYNPWLCRKHQLVFGRGWWCIYYYHWTRNVLYIDPISPSNNSAVWVNTRVCFIRSQTLKNISSILDKYRNSLIISHLIVLNVRGNYEFMFIQTLSCTYRKWRNNTGCDKWLEYKWKHSSYYHWHVEEYASLLAFNVLTLHWRFQELLGNHKDILMSFWRRLYEFTKLNTRW